MGDDADSEFTCNVLPIFTLSPECVACRLE